MNRTRLALVLLLGFAWLGVVGPRGLAAQLVPLSPEIDLRADTFPQKPFVAVQPDGAYMVAWDQRYDSPPWLFYRYVAPGSTPEDAWPSRIVSAVTLKDVEWDGPESMAFDNSGNLLLLWRESTEDLDLRLRLFDSHGAPLGPPVGVRSEASDIFDVPWGGSVAWAGSSWLVTWVAAGAPSYDFNTVFIRRFAKKQ